MNRQKVDRFLNKALKLWIIAYHWALLVSFFLAMTGALVAGWCDEKALSDKFLLTGFILFGVVAFIEVRNLKEWGSNNLSSLVEAAEEVSQACERLKAQGGKVTINGKDFKN